MAMATLAIIFIVIDKIVKIIYCDAYEENKISIIISLRY